MVLDNDDNGDDKGAKKSKATAGSNRLVAEAGIKSDERKYRSAQHRAERNVARKDHAQKKYAEHAQKGKRIEH